MGTTEAAGGGCCCCPTVDLLRSEPMQLVQLIIPIESSRHAISYVGDLGLFQLKDLNAENSPFQRTYATQETTTDPSKHVQLGSVSVRT